MAADEIGYARAGGFEIAYVSCGAGPHDLLYLGIQLGSFESTLDAVARPRFVDPLTRIARFISFDRRGIGSSQRAPGAVPLEDQVADVLAVLDATASTEAALVGTGDGAMLAVAFAAIHPERVSHLVLMHGQARVTRAPGYEWAMSEEERDVRLLEANQTDWGKGNHAVRLMAAHWADQDPRVHELFARSQRLLGTPAEIRPHFEVLGRMDVRQILPQVQAPTLVLDRPQATAFDSRHARYLAEQIPGAELRELPGRDPLIVGDGVEATVDAIAGFITGSRPSADPDRALSTVVFTDVVDSTAKAAAMGDADWRRLLVRFEGISRESISRFHGRPIKATGDGFLATFDGPAAAVHSAATVARDVAELGIEIRAGVHTGEIEFVGEDIAGIAVHIGARIGALGEPGEVIVSSTVRDLVVGSGIEFEPAGDHSLKGVPGEWSLFRAVDA